MTHDEAQAELKAMTKRELYVMYFGLYCKLSWFESDLSRLLKRQILTAFLYSDFSGVERVFRRMRWYIKCGEIR